MIEGYVNHKRRIWMLMTHGGMGKARRFDWTFSDDFIRIKNENERPEDESSLTYSLTELFAILDWLKQKFGAEWFPLANNVEKLSQDQATDGLGVAIMRQQPGLIRHAQVHLT